MKKEVKPKIIIGILSCQRYKSKMDQVRSTWLSQPLPENLEAYFLVGRPGQPSSLEGDVLYLDCPDYYEDLSKKTYEFLKFVYREKNFDYVFKCDDDTYVNVTRVARFPFEAHDYIGLRICLINREKFRYYHFGKVENASFNKRHQGDWIGPWAAGGSGYFLSRYAVSKVLEEDESITEELYEDKMIGDVMTRANIQLHHTKKLHNIPKEAKYGKLMDKVMTMHPLPPLSIKFRYRYQISDGLRKEIYKWLYLIRQFIYVYERKISTRWFQHRFGVPRDIVK